MLNFTEQNFINDHNKDQILQKINNWLHIHDYDGLKSVYFLVTKGEQLSNYQGANLAHLAVLNKNPEVLKFIENELEDFDLNQQDKNGWNPLDYAVKTKDNECTSILSEKMDN